jgi:hypothetical protein
VPELYLNADFFGIVLEPGKACAGRFVFDQLQNSSIPLQSKELVFSQVYISLTVCLRCTRKSSNASVCLLCVVSSVRELRFRIGRVVKGTGGVLRHAQGLG